MWLRSFSLKRPCNSVNLIHSKHCCLVNKSSLSPWRMRPQMARGRARHPCYPGVIPAVPAMAPEMGVRSSGTSQPLDYPLVDCMHSRPSPKMFKWLVHGLIGRRGQSGPETKCFNQLIQSSLYGTTLPCLVLFNNQNKKRGWKWLRETVTKSG